jgi:hypothetical protein
MLLAIRRASSMVSTWGYVSISSRLTSIHVGEGLTVSIQHFIAAGYLLH